MICIWSISICVYSLLQSILFESPLLSIPAQSLRLVLMMIWWLMVPCSGFLVAVSLLISLIGLSALTRTSSPDRSIINLLFNPEINEDEPPQGVTVPLQFVGRAGSVVLYVFLVPARFRFLWTGRHCCPWGFRRSPSRISGCGLSTRRAEDTAFLSGKGSAPPAAAPGGRRFAAGSFPLSGRPGSGRPPRRSSAARCGTPPWQTARPMSPAQYPSPNPRFYLPARRGAPAKITYLPVPYPSPASRLLYQILPYRAEKIKTVRDVGGSPLKNVKATPHNCVCESQPSFCSTSAVPKMGNTYSIPPFSEL